MLLQNLSGLIWPTLISLPFIALAFGESKKRWAISEVLLSATLVLAIVGCVHLVLSTSVAPMSGLFNITLLNATILILISFIALVVLRYAKSNLEGDIDDKRFLRWFVATVLSVIVTVTTNNMLVFWLAWVSISLCLHQLLMFYPDRPRAKLAAHKKFIFARLAEVLLGVAFIILYNQHQTLIISEILFQLTSSQLTISHQIAAVLIATVALIKCAQLPLHGWLIQVVESPTPVSALLHAGIINMGGFLLLSFAPLFGQSLYAKWLVLAVAGISTLIAAMVIMTRISIKVRLAWSTVAQMGLMLLECGLGLYELALLHLVAHSCYKAHAFLNAGNAVNHYLHTEFTQATLPSGMAWIASIAVTAAGIFAAVAILEIQPPVTPWLLIGIAVSTLLAFRFGRIMSLSLTRTLLFGALMITIYTELKWGAHLLIPEMTVSYSMLADIWVSMMFMTLMVSYFYLQYFPNTAFSRKLFIALNAGFYLDEWASKVTLQLWPIHLNNMSRKSVIYTEEATS